MAKNAATGELDAGANRRTDKWTAAGKCPQFRITWCGANLPGRSLICKKLQEEGWGGGGAPSQTGLIACKIYSEEDFLNLAPTFQRKHSCQV